jgi:hypothetical protein
MTRVMLDDAVTGDEDEDDNMLEAFHNAILCSPIA